MYRYSLLSPTVYGQMGRGTKLDTSVHPPAVHHLHIVLDMPPRDDLHGDSPCFLVTPRLAKYLATSALSGFKLEEVRAEWNEQYLERHPDAPTPEVFWLKAEGRPLVDDFASDRHGRLVVSRAAMEALRRFRLEECKVYDAENPPTPEQVLEDSWEDARRAVEASRDARKRRSAT